MPSTPKDWFRSQGLKPLSWQDVLESVESRLSAEHFERFERAHRAFVAYPTVHTCSGFYDLVSRQGLQDLLACYRFHRLLQIAESFRSEAPHDAHVLDFGAGGGFLGGYLRDVLGARVSVADISPGTRDALAAKGFKTFDLAEKPPLPVFDLILCADSLCEVHADEDDWLSDPANAQAPNLPDEVEARYGLAEKLSPLKPFLAPQGVVLIHEPVQSDPFWKGALNLVESHGWTADLRGSEGARHLRLQHR